MKIFDYEKVIIITFFLGIILMSTGYYVYKIHFDWSLSKLIGIFLI